jgi:hypothetical protein
MAHFLTLINNNNPQVYNYNLSAKIMCLKIMCSLNIGCCLSNCYCCN